MTDNPSNPTSDTTIESRPYLGDPQVVDKIIRHVAREGVNCRAAIRQGILTSQDANLIDEKETTNAAAIFLGRNRRYAIDSNWNIPGVIDAFVANELAVDAKGPEAIVASGLCNLLNEIDDRLKRLNKADDPQWERHVEDILEKYRNVFLGLSIAPAAEPAAEPAPLEPVVAAPIPSVLLPTPPVPTAQPQPVVVAPTAPVKPTPTAAPARVEAVAAAPASSSGRKWIFVLVLLVLFVGGAIFLVRKPAPEPPKAATPPPPPPKPTPAVTAVLLDGKIQLLKENGETRKTVGLANSSETIVRLFDAYLEAEKEQFLVSKTWQQPDSEGPVSNDLWLLDHAGNERLVNPAVLHARLSSDGSKIAYSTSDAVLQVEDKAGTELAEVRGVYEPVWRKENEVAFLMVADGHEVWPPDALSIATLDLTTKQVSIVTDGRFDDVVLECHPSGKWLLLTAGAETGLASFWKVPAAGGEPIQITNVRMNETDEQWVPTPYQTAVWSKNGRWFLYDFKDGIIEQTWGLEFDDKGDLKRAVWLADGLFPRWSDDRSFICMKRKGESFELVLEKLPGM